MTKYFDGFPREYIDFLWELRMNNNTEWFNENRERYDLLVKKPMKLFADEMCERLNNETAAKKLTRRVYDAIMLLEDNPYMGTELRRKFGVETDLRFLVVAKQMVFYRVVENDHIEVTRVLDGRQDYLALLF